MAGRQWRLSEASYVALAEERGATLVTEDAQVLRLASALAVPLA